MAETANVSVEIRAFGVSLQQILIGLTRNVEILVDSPAAKLDLENGLVVVVSHAGQRAGLQRHAIRQGATVR